jgi:Raf kinase inhibitor-like YbhB/YbcL family protein
MEISSNAFTNNSLIPIKYTCDGEGASPQLSWTDASENTKSFVLVVDDPDAPNGTFTHWILYNLPPEVNSLTENIKQLPQGTKVGVNSWHKHAYGAPCPPTRNHHYYFKLYALDATLDLPKETGGKEIQQAISNHVLAEAYLIGIYK